MTITGQSRPTQHVYQPTYERLPFNEMANLGMATKKSYDTQKDKNRALEASYIRDLGGGDVAKGQMLQGIMSGMIGQAEKDSPELAGIEFQNKFDDIVRAGTQLANGGMGGASLSEMEQTKKKYAAAMAEQAKFPNAPAWATAKNRKLGAVYEQGGTDDMVAFNRDYFGNGSNDFVSVEEALNTKSTGEFLDDELKGWESQMSEDGTTTGVSREEMALTIGWEKDEKGNPVFSGKLPKSIVNSPTYDRMVSEAMVEIDNGIRRGSGLEPGTEEYNKALSNRILEDYYNRAVDKLSKYESSNINTSFLKYQDALKGGGIEGEEVPTTAIDQFFNSPTADFDNEVIYELGDMTEASSQERSAGKDATKSFKGTDKYILNFADVTNEKLTDFKTITDFYKGDKDFGKLYKRTALAEGGALFDAYDIEKGRTKFTDTTDELGVVTETAEQKKRGALGSAKRDAIKNIEAMAKTAGVEVTVDESSTAEEMSNFLDTEVRPAFEGMAEEVKTLSAKHLNPDTGKQYSAKEQAEMSESIELFTTAIRGINGKYGVQIPHGNATPNKVNIDGVPYLNYGLMVTDDELDAILDGAVEMDPKNPKASKVRGYLEKHGIITSTGNNYTVNGKASPMYMVNISQDVSNINMGKLVRANRAETKYTKYKNEEDIWLTNYINNSKKRGYANLVK